MDKIKEFCSDIFKVKYVVAVIVIAAIIFFVLKATGVIGGVKEIRQAQEVTSKSITKVQELVASQDKVVERIYNTTIREVQKTNVDIQTHVQNLDADSVVVELNTLLDQYRRERSGD